MEILVLIKETQPVNLCKLICVMSDSIQCNNLYKNDFKNNLYNVLCLYFQTYCFYSLFYLIFLHG